MSQPGVEHGIRAFGQMMLRLPILGLQFDEHNTKSWYSLSPSTHTLGLDMLLEIGFENVIRGVYIICTSAF